MKPLQKVKRFVDVQKFNLWFKIHTPPVLPDPVTLIGVIRAETHPDTKSPFFWWAYTCQLAYNYAVWVSFRPVD